jgi:ParB family chromosome partitioning protein
MSTVPCVLLENSDGFEYVSVVENLQREGLGMFDEARAIKRLYARSGGNLEKTAKLLSISEVELTRKLRLTELSRAEAQAVSRLGLCEKTAVQLLRIPSSVRFYAIKLSAERGFSEETVMKLCDTLEAFENPSLEVLERAVEGLSVGNAQLVGSVKGEEASDTLTMKRSKGVIRDMRIFENSLRRSLEMLRSAGCEAELETSDGDGETVYKIRVKR